MTRLLTLAALCLVWLGLNAAMAAAAVYFGRAITDLGPTHDPADCEACKAASDPIMERLDLDMWAVEMQEPSR